MRRDRRLGYEERVEFFGPLDDKLFGTTYRPASRSGGGLLVCPPICADFLFNYRRETSIARHLAANGVAGQRFHYRGTGHSDGDPQGTTFETMVDDAAAAHDHLVTGTGAEAVTFMGIRIGALVAAAAAQRWPGAPLVLIEPTVDPLRFFRDVFRSRMAANVKTGAEERVTSQQMRAEIEAAGRTDVLGYQVDRALYDTLSPRSLDAEIGDSTKDVLLVQLSSTSELRQEYVGLRERLEGRGVTVEVAVVDDPEGWWIDDSEVLPNEVVIEVVDRWVRERVGTASVSDGRVQ